MSKNCVEVNIEIECFDKSFRNLFLNGFEEWAELRLDAFLVDRLLLA